MKLDDRRADRKAEAETSLLCCEKRLKNLVLPRWRQSGTTIINFHLDPAVVGRCGADRNGACREDDESLHRHARLPRLRSGSCSRRQSAQRAPGAIAWTCQVRFDPSSFVRRRGTVSIASVFRPKEAVTTLRKCVGAMRLRRVNVCEPCSCGGYWTTVQST